MKKYRITPEQEAYIVEHTNDRPRTAAAEAAGVSIRTFYRIAKKHGCIIDYGRSRRRADWVEIVKQHYATMSGHEIERKFGITRNRANVIARSLGLKHSPETQERIKRELIEGMCNTLKTRDYAAQGKKWKLHRRMDEMRIWNGEQQRTRLRFKQMPSKAYKAKWTLIHSHGYIAAGDADPFKLYFDEHTRRRDNNLRKNGHEAYYTKRYHLHFSPAPGYNPAEVERATSHDRQARKIVIS